MGPRPRKGTEYSRETVYSGQHVIDKALGIYTKISKHVNRGRRGPFEGGLLNGLGLLVPTDAEGVGEVGGDGAAVRGGVDSPEVELGLGVEELAVALHPVHLEGVVGLDVGHMVRGRLEDGELVPGESRPVEDQVALDVLAVDGNGQGTVVAVDVGRRIDDVVEVPVDPGKLGRRGRVVRS
jgi:hypothetical protein